MKIPNWYCDVCGAAHPISVEICFACCPSCDYGFGFWTCFGLCLQTNLDSTAVHLSQVALVQYHLFRSSGDRLATVIATYNVLRRVFHHYLGLDIGLAIVISISTWMRMGTVDSGVFSAGSDCDCDFLKAMSIDAFSLVTLNEIHQTCLLTFYSFAPCYPARQGFSLDAARDFLTVIDLETRPGIYHVLAEVENVTGIWTTTSILVYLDHCAPALCLLFLERTCRFLVGSLDRCGTEIVFSAICWRLYSEASHSRRVHLVRDLDRDHGRHRDHHPLKLVHAV